MAQKRMFDKRIVESDRFIDLPNSSKALYFMAGMSADDRGFFQPRQLQKISGFSDDDFKILIAKGYFISFGSGVMVVTDWNKNNWLDKRRITETEYIDELNMLSLINEKYELENSCLANAKPMLSEYSIEENRIEENRIDKNIYTSEDTVGIPPDNLKEQKHKYGEFKHVLLTDKEYNKLKEDYSNYEELIKYLDEYIEMKGYKAKSHYLCIKKWVVDAVKKQDFKNYWNSEDTKKVPNWINKDLKSEEVSQEELNDLQRDWNDIF